MCVCVCVYVSVCVCVCVCVYNRSIVTKRMEGIRVGVLTPLYSRTSTRLTNSDIIL